MRLANFLKRALPLILLDLVGVIVSFWVALLFRFDGLIPHASMQVLPLVLPLVLLAHLVSNSIFKLYHRLWRYASSYEVVAIGAAVALTTLFCMTISLVWSVERP